jgi:hypothetical protein
VGFAPGGAGEGPDAAALGPLRFKFHGVGERQGPEERPGFLSSLGFGFRGPKWSAAICRFGCVCVSTHIRGTKSVQCWAFRWWGVSTMSNASDVQFVRNRYAKGMGASVMNLVRFRLANISIQYMQYAWVGDLVRQGRIHIKVDSGDSYDHVTDTIGIDDPKCWFHVLVHEGTHAVIDACNPGLSITKGNGEACAYVAETVFNIAWRKEVPDFNVPHLARPVASLARRILSHNERGAKGLFECDPASVAEINAILGKHWPVNRVDRMNGIRGV